MKKTIILGLVALGLVGCATPRAYNKIDAEARPLLTSMETVLIVKSSEIGSAIDISNVSGATGGGLIPALIDAGVNSSRTKKAEALIGPIRDKLIDHDFAADLEAALEEQLASVDVNGANDVELVRAETKDFRQLRISKSSADIVMFIVADHELSPDFASIIANASVMVYPVKHELNQYKEKPDSDDKLAEPKDNIYRNVFKSVIPMEVAGDREINAEAVSNMSSADLVDMLVLSAQKLAKQIANDFVIDDDETKK